MDGDNSSMTMCAELQSQRFHDGASTSAEQSSAVRDTDGSQLVGVPVAVSCPSTASVANVAGSGEKRKRGRPPRGVAAKVPPPKRQREEEEEDVCFICFDGGSLVLCDHKGCPKAYHPACIKRDEEFFRSAAKWECGWHICSVCQKTSSHYMCYTCTYSVCKGCTENAEYFSIRRNKGFCSTCMSIIMLIEKIDQGNKEMVQVDFDDQRNWEYLFKVYWMHLKEKLSLTQSELIQAKNPWKESDAVHAKRQRQRLPFTGNSFDHSELKKPKEMQDPPFEDPPSTEICTIVGSENLKTEEGITPMGASSLNGHIEWASEEFLELIAHMKNGESFTLSDIHVQELLLEYIERHNLRDPHQKSQIICDSRLKVLFGKPRVGHIEMLKLLEYHVVIKEGSQKGAFIPAGIVGTVTSHMEADDDNNDSNGISCLNNKNKKHKLNRNSEEKQLQINLNEYAAINAHNINLIYMRRDFMENLIEDMEKFHDRVVGSVVRIKIPSNDQKQEIYRLVHVVGTSNSSVPYKIGNKTADVLVEVINLNKKEDITIDSLSNQDFTEDECRKLRQSMKCGLVKRLTIGEIQKKAMELCAVKLNEHLETEILRLNHLRDRASEKGHIKELRECVEKLELLKTPEEHQRKLLAVPEVQADPKMDPNYESEEDAGGSENKKQVEYPWPRCARSSRREDKLISDKLMSSLRNAKEGSIMARCKMSENGEAHRNNILKKLGNHHNGCLAADRSASETSTASVSTLNSTSSKISETETLWHYRDPCGRIQGPFSVMQLRKWNTSGLFPPDMSIWINHEHDDSVLLTNALNGLFQKAHDEISTQSLDLPSAPSVNSGDASKGGSSSSFPQCLDLNNSCSDKVQPSSQEHLGQVVQDSSGSTTSHSIQCNNKENFGHSSSGQDCGSLTGNRSSVSTNSASSFASIIKSSDFPDLPSPTPKTNHDDVEAQAAEKLLSLSSAHPVCSSHIQDLPSPTPKPKGDAPVGQVVIGGAQLQDSGHIRSSASSPVIGRAQLPDTANEQVIDSSVKPAEAANDSTLSYWRALFGEPIELSTLDEESVSDLLAEVDALECQTQSGMGSPTSAMTPVSKSDYFSFIEELSTPTPDPAKSDALSSTEDIQLAFEPLKGASCDYLHL